jgi:pimeloyl-ACP methyl ester carboxylesterase
MTTCFLLAGAYGSTDTLKYQLQGKITAGTVTVPIGYPNFGISDWELEAGREMLDQAFIDFTGGGPITIFAHSAGARVVNLWLQQYGQTRADDGLVDVSTTKIYCIGDSTNRFGGVYYEEDHAPPQDTPYDLTVITRQYDGFADWPGDDTNNDAVTNAVYGQPYVHPDYFGVDPSPHADGNYLYTAGNIKYVWSQTYPLPSVLPTNTLLKQWGLNDPPTSGDWVSLEDQAKRPAIDAAYAVPATARPVLIPPPAYV